jgi:predicted NAD-dependent protein-ADP-ribosyltransferase YbiA (DUF1768 family)
MPATLNFCTIVTEAFFKALKTNRGSKMHGPTDKHARPFVDHFEAPVYLDDCNRAKGFYRVFSSNAGAKKGVILVQRQVDGTYKAVLVFEGCGGLSNFTDGEIPCNIECDGVLEATGMNTSEAMWKLICIAIHSGIFFDKEDKIAEAINRLQVAKDVTDSTKSTHCLEFLSKYWDSVSVDAMFATIAAKWAQTDYMEKLVAFFDALFVFEGYEVIPGVSIWTCDIDFVEANKFDGLWGVKLTHEKVMAQMEIYDCDAWFAAIGKPEEQKKCIVWYNCTNFLDALLTYGKNQLGSVLGKVFAELKKLHIPAFKETYANSIVFKVVDGVECFETKLDTIKAFYDANAGDYATEADKKLVAKHTAEHEKLTVLDGERFSISCAIGLEKDLLRPAKTARTGRMLSGPF